jgi:hypothetical protein
MYDTAPGVNYVFGILCKSVGSVVVVSCGRWSGGLCVVVGLIAALIAPPFHRAGKPSVLRPS